MCFICGGSANKKINQVTLFPTLRIYHSINIISPQNKKLQKLLFNYLKLVKIFITKDKICIILYEYVVYQLKEEL